MKQFQEISVVTGLKLWPIHKGTKLQLRDLPLPNEILRVYQEETLLIEQNIYCYYYYNSQLENANQLIN